MFSRYSYNVLAFTTIIPLTDVLTSNVMTFGNKLNIYWRYEIVGYLTKGDDKHINQVSTCQWDKPNVLIYNCQ